jgi:hypothetical protein
VELGLGTVATTGREFMEEFLISFKVGLVTVVPLMRTRRQPVPEESMIARQ